MFFFLKTLQSFFYCLPFWALKFFARILACCLYFNARKRKIAYRNLKIAFPSKRYSEIMTILKKSYYNFSLSLIETIAPYRFLSFIDFEGEEQLTEPGICVGIHAGSWELINLFFAQKYGYAILAKPQKNKRLDSFLNQVRRSSGMKVSFNLRSLIKHIKNGLYAGLVVDHGAEENALLASFFSQTVPYPRGAVFLAKKYKKKIYPFLNYRTGGFHQKLKLLGVIEPESGSERDLIETINQFYQKELADHPQGYLWWHKRFKRKQNRSVAIIDDAKPGHLKQSQALLSILKEESFYSIREQVVFIKYKNYFSRMAANFAAAICPSFYPRSMKFLRFFLDKESFQKISGQFFDVVIGTGNFTAPVVKILSSALGARSAVVLRTNISPAKFDLAIIPEHDRLYLTAAVKIKGALVYHQGLEGKKEKCKDFFQLGEGKKISVFIGGPIFEQKEFIDNLKKFLAQIKFFARDKNYKLLLSTSRRTPTEAEEYLEKEFSGFELTEALVIAGKKNYDFVFEGFVLLSEIVFCSSESISMLSEISALGKPCVCVSFETEDDKRQVFLDSMAEEVNFLKNPFKIKDNNLKTSNLFSKNRIIVAKAVKKLLTQA